MRRLWANGLAALVCVHPLLADGPSGLGQCLALMGSAGIRDRDEERAGRTIAVPAAAGVAGWLANSARADEVIYAGPGPRREPVR